MPKAYRFAWILVALFALFSGGCAAFDEFHPDDDAEDYGYEANYSAKSRTP